MSDDETPNPAAFAPPEAHPTPPEAPAESPPPTRPAWLMPGLAAVAGLLVGAGVVGLAWAASGSSETKPAAVPSASVSAAATFNLTGMMELNQLSLQSGACQGTGGYSDITSGASVTVYDGGGQVVATGHLGAGTRSGLKCDFDVWVPDVPAGAKFYQVEISHRGKITLSADDAKAGRFAASLG